MIHRWTIRDGELRAREELSRALSLSGLVAAVLVARGVAGPAQARTFLSPKLSQLPDPDQIPGMAAAAVRLADAVVRREAVWVYADYDVDGVTSAALLTEFLEQCGAPARVHLPRRDREGYGLHSGTLEEIAGQGGQLVVTADCGINALEAGRRAVELALDLIITDHHTPGAELPPAVAVVNPKLPGAVYPDVSIAGVGVAWNLAAAVRRELRTRGHFKANGLPDPDLRSLLDLVALGTVADVVPLHNVNRIFASYGLEVMNRTPRPGISALCEVAGVNGPLRAGHIGFQFGPRLNAAGRMADPVAALQLLTSRRVEDARPVAEALDRLNQQRRTEERELFERAAGRVDRESWWPQRWSLVTEGEAWHPGVIGIVASRLAERFYRPAVVLSVMDGEARGSARSIRGLDLHRALGECKDLLTRYGGHAAAAGLQLPVANIGPFRERFEAVVRATLGEADLVPEVVIDAEVGFADLGREAVAGLSRLEPFGSGNPGPVFATLAAEVLETRTMGRDQEHRKFRLEHRGHRLEAVAWRRARELAQIVAGQSIDVAFTPQLRTWRGVESVQLQVAAVRTSS